MDGELLREVQRDDSVAKGQLRVTGVPFFLISSGDSKTYALSGAWHHVASAPRSLTSCTTSLGHGA